MLIHTLATPETMGGHPSGIFAALGTIILGVIALAALISAIIPTYRESHYHGTRNKPSWVRVTLAVIAVAVAGVTVLAGFGTIALIAADQKTVDAWRADLADWAEDTYGVTAGTDELEYNDDLFSEDNNMSGDVVADGDIRHVNLKYVGDEAFLLDAGSDGSAELPRKADR